MNFTRKFSHFHGTLLKPNCIATDRELWQQPTNLKIAVDVIVKLFVGLSSRYCICRYVLGIRTMNVNKNKLYELLSVSLYNRCNKYEYYRLKLFKITVE